MNTVRTSSFAPGEQFNVWSHGFVGVALWTLTLAAILTFGGKMPSNAELYWCQPFGMLVVCAASGWYHASPNDVRLRVDRSAISLGIALSATGHIVGLHLPTPRELLLAVWILAVCGIVLEAVRRTEDEWMSTVLLAGNALTAVFGTNPLRMGHFPELFIWAGIGAYAFGFAFFLYESSRRRNVPWAHGVWHVSVLVGGALHCAPFLVEMARL